MFDQTTEIKLFSGEEGHSELLAKMHFDKMFVEFEQDRVDDLGLFADLTPQDFELVVPGAEQAAADEVELLLN